MLSQCAQPPTWRTGVSLFVWLPPLDLTAWLALPVATLPPVYLSGSQEHENEITEQKIKDESHVLHNLLLGVSCQQKKKKKKTKRGNNCMGKPLKQFVHYLYYACCCCLCAMADRWKHKADDTIYLFTCLSTFYLAISIRQSNLLDSEPVII
jgi:hypothetical protein